MPKISIIVPTRDSVSDSFLRLHNSLQLYADSQEEVFITEGDGLNQKYNRGVEKSTGDYLVFLHDDIEVTPGWLDVLPEAVGSFQTEEKGAGITIWGGHFTPEEKYHAEPIGHPQYSAFLCLTREAWEKIGPFDEHYKEPGYRDVDYGLQIAKAGYQIECLPGKIIHHAYHMGRLEAANKTYLEEKWNL